MKHMTAAIVFGVAITLGATEVRAEDSAANPAVVADEHARVVRLAYDAAHIAHALQYHQARTMLALIGDYTRYGYSERITENNWFFSQIEELELQLPRMTSAAGRMELTGENAQQMDALLSGLGNLLAASQEVHAAIKSGDIDEANRLYIERTDEAYNAVVGAAHTLVSNSDREIRMIGLKSR